LVKTTCDRVGDLVEGRNSRMLGAVTMLVRGKGEMLSEDGEKAGFQDLHGGAKKADGTVGNGKTGGFTGFGDRDDD